MGTVNEKEFAKFEHEFMSSLTKAPKSWYESIGKVFVSDEMFNVLKMIRRSLYTLGQVNFSFFIIILYYIMLNSFILFIDN